MPITYPTHHTQFMNHAKHTSCSIIYISLIIQSYWTKTDHLGTTNIQNTALPRPAPRSGEAVSLRRVPPPPRRGHKIRGMGNAGSRLGETPLAWASCLLAQNTLWSPGWPLAQEDLGEPLHISPGRVKLAWAKLSVSTTVCTCTTHSHTQQRFPSSSYTHSSTQTQANHKSQRYKTKHTTRRESSFPYLDKLAENLDTSNCGGRTASRNGLEAGEQRENGSVRNPNNNLRKNRPRKGNYESESTYVS